MTGPREKITRYYADRCRACGKPDAYPVCDPTTRHADDARSIGYTAVIMLIGFVVVLAIAASVAI